ncbi:hypothetical protein EJB05_45211 [Eragrostis curvula]|uniref:Phytocyanin domain-containing protein n=1 Tax=Eragrostis curvula TaxID=38414 RepID=A0A5J9TJL9_9POAL|nr:hypothetical protein EJB05_45211 [Eragrostis curvula]
MASGVSFPAAAAAALVLVAALAVSAASAVPVVYVVGGEERGWRKPTPSDETYNHWASRNRFRVGDFLQFKYDKNDSVLVVSRDDYKVCSASKPAQRFDGGDTRFRLDHSGFFYFVSGAEGHCDAGQRMTARVMAQGEGRQVVAPAAAPHAMSPRAGGGDDEGGSYAPGSGGGGGGSYKPAPGAGSGSGSGTGTVSRPPPPPPSTSGGVASVRAPSLFSGYHVVVGTVLGIALLILAA